MRHIVLSRRMSVIATLLLAAAAGAAISAAVISFRSAAPVVSVRVKFDAVPKRYRQLNLSPQQERAIADVIAASKPRTDSVLAQVIPRLTDILVDVDNEVRAHLTPEQRRKLGPAREPKVMKKRKTTAGRVLGVDTLR